MYVLLQNVQCGLFDFFIQIGQGFFYFKWSQLYFKLLFIMECTICLEHMYDLMYYCYEHVLPVPDVAFLIVLEYV